MTRIWRYLMGGAMLITLWAIPAAAQATGTGDESPEAELLRQRIEARFGERLRQELDLTDDQAAKLRTTSREFALKRRELFRAERGYRLALSDQMRPGIAADQDSVARLTDRIARTRGELSRSYEDEVEAMKFLSPVQRARYFQLRERLLERVRDVRAARRDARAEEKEARGTAPAAGRLRPRARVLRP